MYAISIDSGGTKVVGAVVDGDGNILTKKRYDIPERDGNFLIATFRDICCFANKLQKFFKQSAKKKWRLKGF